LRELLTLAGDVRPAVLGPDLLQHRAQSHEASDCVERDVILWRCRVAIQHYIACSYPIVVVGGGLLAVSRAAASHRKQR
jgi:hypothetical protein